MVCINEIKKFLKKNLSMSRYNHTVKVTALAEKLARKHGIKKLTEIKIAALLHDCRKTRPGAGEHSFLSARAARKKFGIKDKDILNAIKYHTFGNRRMNDFAKILYLADISEPGRNFPEAVRIRRMAFKNIDSAMILALTAKIRYVMSSGFPVSIESVMLYNNLVNQKI
ncbi:MAG: putative nicotinate-nucleotide adenylyltransferase [Elusimicrobia bacterium ADurb.Bin231]|nr:MAG: putative nicotinate-nucleotide adenylyltransferase [Elusimicrobia bacterium ADurb.Bin231]